MTKISHYADRLYGCVFFVAMVMIDNTSDLSKGVCVKCMNSNQEPGSGDMGMHMTTCTVFFRHNGSLHVVADKWRDSGFEQFTLILYSGLFSWGANFHYFHGAPKFSTHKIFHTLRSTVCTCSNLDQRRFVMALFRYLHPIDSVLDTQGPLSQAVPPVMAEEVNRTK